MLIGTTLTNKEAILEELSSLKEILRQKLTEVVQAEEKMHQNHLALARHASRMLGQTNSSTEIIASSHQLLLENKNNLTQQLAKLNCEVQLLRRRQEILDHHLLQMERSRIRRAASPEKFLLDKTRMGWLQNEERYGKGVIASDPIQDKKYAENFVNLVRQYIDACAESFYSEAKGYYRIFAQVNNVLDAVVDTYFSDGRQLDFSIFFDQLNEEQKSERNKLRA